jgi:hypothetical protein
MGKQLQFKRNWRWFSTFTIGLFCYFRKESKRNYSWKYQKATSLNVNQY